MAAMAPAVGQVRGVATSSAPQHRGIWWDRRVIAADQPSK